GILCYAGTLSSSVTATSKAKAEVFVGSRVSAQLGKGESIPSSLAATSTPVVRGQGVILGQGAVDVLGVDRASFARAACWDRSFGSTSLPDLLAALAPGPSESRVPVLIVGSHFTPTGSLTLIAVPAHTVAYRTVATPK